jgi:hypothetical protein
VAVSLWEAAPDGVRSRPCALTLLKQPY